MSSMRNAFANLWLLINHKKKVLNMQHSLKMKIQKFEMHNKSSKYITSDIIEINV